MSEMPSEGRASGTRSRRRASPPSEAREDRTNARTALALLLMGGALIGPFVWRVQHDRSAFWEAGQRAEVDGEPSVAVDAYRRVLRARLPFGEGPAPAIARLEAIAEEAAAADDPELEREAWLAIRGGLMSSRAHDVPETAALARADARLVALDEAFADAGMLGPRPARRRALIEASAPLSPPGLGASLGIFVAFGLLGAVAARGISPALRLEGARGTLVLVSALAVFGAALLALHLA